MWIRLQHTAAPKPRISRFRPAQPKVQISGPSRKSRSPRCSTSVFFPLSTFHTPGKVPGSFRQVLHLAPTKNTSPRVCFRYSPASALEHSPIYPSLGPPSSIRIRITCGTELPMSGRFFLSFFSRSPIASTSAGAQVSVLPKSGRGRAAVRGIGGPMRLNSGLRCGHGESSPL